MGNNLEQETKNAPLCGEENLQAYKRKGAGICDYNLKECPYAVLPEDKKFHPNFAHLKSRTDLLFCSHHSE